MAYLCEIVQVIDGIEQCTKFVEYSPFFQQLTKDEIQSISYSLFQIAALFIGYAVIAKAVNSL